jgi:Domain of unknown function (DUF1932)
MATHGTRRAAEMEEVADTLRELGIEPHMAHATVVRQRQMGEVGKREPVKSAKSGSGRDMLAAISFALSSDHKH